ncbi:hypothetical protein D3C86_1327450 [compost metagenome]
MGKSDLLWWEKTVEYAFVLLHLGDAAALPFAGRPEQAWGDLLVQGVLKNICLIEFKRTKDSIGSEFEKYPNFLDFSRTTRSNKAVQPDLLLRDFREVFLELLSEQSHEQYERVIEFGKKSHRFVFGKSDGTSFGLRATTYAGIQEDTLVPDDPTKEWGSDLQTAAEYLKVLAQLRNCWDEENGVSGSSAMGMVMGVSEDGAVIIPASDLLKLAVDHQLVPAPIVMADPANEPSYPAPGF